MEPLGSSAGGAPYFDVAVFVLADTVLAEVSGGLGNIAADLTAL